MIAFNSHHELFQHDFIPNVLCGNNTSAIRVRLLKFFLQGRPETSGRPFKPAFFELFQPRTGMANVFEGKFPNCGSFLEKIFGVWKLEFTSVFNIFPVMF